MHGADLQQYKLFLLLFSEIPANMRLYLAVAVLMLAFVAYTGKSTAAGKQRVCFSCAVY